MKTFKGLPLSPPPTHRVHDNGRVHKVVGPVGAALDVQRQVPVHPARREVVASLEGTNETVAFLYFFYRKPDFL